MDSMTVRELREQLVSLPEEAKIMVAADPEGNGFRALSCVQHDPGVLDGWRGDGWESIAAEDVGTEYDEADVTYRVVMWP